MVEAIGHMVAGSLATGGVAGPAAGIHPLLAVAGSVGVNGDQADIAFAQLPAPGVHTLGTCPKGDVIYLRSDQGGVEAPALKMFDYCSCDFTCLFVPQKDRKITSQCRF